MFYWGWLLCNNAWGAEKRLKGSQFKRKQTETNGCVFARRSAQLKQEKNQETPTHPNKHHSLMQQMVTWLCVCVHVCVCVCLSAWNFLCQGADHSRHGPKQARVSGRRTQRDRRRARQRSGVGEAVRKKRESRGKRRKDERRNRIIQLLTAVTGGQQQSELRSLSASVGAIVFTSHDCRLLLLPSPPFLLVWVVSRCCFPSLAKNI